MSDFDFEWAKNYAEKWVEHKTIYESETSESVFARCFLALLKECDEYREKLVMLMKVVPESHYEECAYLNDPDSDPEQCNCGVNQVYKEAREVLEKYNKERCIHEFTKKEKTPPIKSFIALADFHTNTNNEFKILEGDFTDTYNDGWQDGFNKCLELIKQKLGG